MAKIVGPVPPFIGTRDNVTIYPMNGEYIARTKSSLTGKRVKKDPAFARTMEWAGRLKQGARIASAVYRLMPVDGRVYKQYREITGKAMSLLKEGFSVGDVFTMLEAVYLPQFMKASETVIAGMKSEAKSKVKPETKPNIKLPGRDVCNFHDRYSPYDRCNSKCNMYNNANDGVYLLCAVHSIYPEIRNDAYNGIYIRGYKCRQCNQCIQSI
jgi:hypothetical protein